MRHDPTRSRTRAQRAVGQVFHRDERSADQGAQGGGNREESGGESLDVQRAVQGVIERLDGALSAREDRQAERLIEALGNVVDRVERVDERRRPIPRERQAGGDDQDQAATGQAGERGDGTGADPRERGRTIRTERGDVYEIPTGPNWSGFRAQDIMDGRDRQYERLWRSDSRSRFDRNPGMDDRCAAFLRHLMSGRKEAADRLRQEIDDLYLRSLPSYDGDPNTNEGVRAATTGDRAALAEGSANATWGYGDGTGAELLPLPVASQIMLARNRASVMRSLVSVFPMTSQTQRIPIIPVVTATSRAEGADFAADITPNPLANMLSAKIIGCRFSATGEFLADTAFNMISVLTERAGSAIGEEEDVQIATSTANGGDITQGLDAHATITDVAEATTGSFFVEDMATLYFNLPKQYRRGAVFLAAGTSLLDIVNAVDGAGNRAFPNGALAEPRGIGDGDPAAEGSVFGKNVFEIPVADDVLYFGDPKWYALGQRAGITIRQDQTLTTNTQEWRIEERIDGRVIETAGSNAADAWRKMVW